MSKKKNILFNTIIIAIGEFCPKIAGLVLLPIYTNEAWVTKAQFGYYDLLTTLISVMIPILTLQAGTAMFRFIIEKKQQQEQCEIITNGLHITVFAMCASSPVVFFAFPAFDIGSKMLIWLFTASEILLFDLKCICRGFGDYKSFSTSIAVASVSSLLGAPLCIIVFRLGFTGILLSLAISDILAICYILLWKKIYRYIDLKRTNRELSRELLMFSLPLVPNKISWWIVKLSDRIIISYVLGIEATAIYAVSNRIPSLYSTLYGTFNTAWQEFASSNAENEDNYNQKIFEDIFVFLTAANVLCISVMPLFFRIFIGETYYSAMQYVPVLFAALFFSSLSSFFSGIMLAQKNTKELGITTLLAASVNIIINALFIKSMGLWAASLSTLIAYVLLAAQRYRSLRKQGQILVIPRNCLLATAAVMTMVMILSYIHSWWSAVISVTVTAWYIGTYCRIIVMSCVRIVWGKCRSFFPH